MRTDFGEPFGSGFEYQQADYPVPDGERYVKVRKFATKTKGAQEAHEAIRPTYMENETVNGTGQEQKLYELIWKRTIASQMADAELEKTTATIVISNSSEKFIATGEVITFDGFLRVYKESYDDDNEQGRRGPYVAASEQRGKTDKKRNPGDSALYPMSAPLYGSQPVRETGRVGRSVVHLHMHLPFDRAATRLCRKRKQ